jgi:hypothetical protein
MLGTPVRRAGFEERRLIGKVAINREPLHAGTLGHGADRRARRPHGAMQLRRGRGNAPASRILSLSALLERVGPPHAHILPNIDVYWNY